MNDSRFTIHNSQLELIIKYFPDLTGRQKEQFAALYDLYADWNAKINVVSRKDFDQLYLRHVLHSLAIAKVCTFGNGARILDVGCGGGFPSVPLAILFPEARFTAADSIRKKMIVFGIGPAGTGKTYLAMAMAIQAFKNGEVGRIILTRPAIEAGEKLGFLPGDLQSKIDPYLRPLYDALYQIMGAESYQHNSEKGLIEVAPLAYMRGRTLDNAYIILDEAQNTTPAQMKMFLTRIGFGSKVIITGDQTQKDLPSGATSGLDTALKVLKNIDDIGFCYLTSSDVVRHPLVQKIVHAYEVYEKKEDTKNKKKKVGKTHGKDRGRK